MVDLKPPCGNTSHALCTAVNTDTTSGSKKGTLCRWRKLTTGCTSAASVWRWWRNYMELLLNMPQWEVPWRVRMVWCVFFSISFFFRPIFRLFLDLAWSVSGNCVVWKDLCFGSWFWNFDPEQLPRPQNLRPLLLQITSLHMSVRSPIPISWQLW